MELPEQLKSVFSSPEVVDEEIDLIGTNDSSYDDEPSEPEPSRKSEVDVDSLIRQRDAIIAEKQRYADEARRLYEYARLLEHEKAKNEEPEPKVPDVKEDPVGFLRHESKKEADELRAEIGRLQNLFSTKSREIDAERAYRTVFEKVAGDENTFRSKNTDYDDAMKHLDGHVLNYFKSQGLDEGTAQAGLGVFKSKLFEDCLALGLPMAETFYMHALQSGFRQEVDPRIAKSKKGLEAGSSLSSTSRSSSSTTRTGEGRLTLEQYQSLAPYDPTRLAIANDKATFSRLVSDGEISLR